MQKEQNESPVIVSFTDLKKKALERECEQTKKVIRQMIQELENLSDGLNEIASPPELYDVKQTARKGE